MHILFLTDNFPPEVNASASRVYERARYWIEWGCKVTVLTCVPNFPEGEIFQGYDNKWVQEENIDGIRVIRVKTYMAPNKGIILRTLDYVSYMFMAIFFSYKVNKPDVVVATSPQFFAGFAGWIVSLFKKRPFVLELGDLWPASIAAVGAMKSKYVMKPLEALEKFLYRRADTIIPVTRSFKKNLEGRGIDPNKMTVVRNGVDLKIHRPSDKKFVDSLRNELNLKGKFVIGYLGTLGMAHGLENVVFAAEKLKSNKDVMFLFVGNGAERDKLVQMVDDKKLANIMFIPRQPKNKISGYWGICDVALVHLKNNKVFSEVIPSKIFEAMAMRKPIIMVGPIGEATEIIKNEKVGLVVEPDDPAKLANAVLQMQNNPALNNFATNSSDSAPRYSREKQARDVLKVLESVERNSN